MSVAWPILREMAPTAYRRAVTAVGRRFWEAGTVGAIARQNLNSFSSQSDMPPVTRGRTRARSVGAGSRSRSRRSSMPRTPPQTSRRSPSNPFLRRSRSVGTQTRLNRSNFARNSRVQRSAYTGPGKSGGFLGSNLYKASKVKNQTMNLTRGVMIQNETGFTSTGQEVVYVGHATCPEASMSFALGLMLTKYLFGQMKVKCEGELSLLLVNLGFVGKVPSRLGGGRMDRIPQRSKHKILGWL